MNFVRVVFLDWERHWLSLRWLNYINLQRLKIRLNANADYAAIACLKHRAPYRMTINQKLLIKIKNIFT